MKPVLQTKFGKGNGNCYAACIASILELPIEDVPNFCKSENWFEDSREWVKQHGFDLLMVVANDEWTPPDTFYIAGGEGGRGCKHTAVFRKDKLVHDPYPKGLGLQSIEDYIFFVPLADDS